MSTSEISSDFKETINASKNNKDFHMYDLEIFQAVRTFNRYLKDSEGFKSLDWHFIKAMAWVESGGPVKLVNKKYVKQERWYNQPLSMGANPDDPGLTELMRLKANKQFYEVVPTEYQRELENRSTIKSKPLSNIRAGIALVLLKMAKFPKDVESVEEKNSSVQDFIADKDYLFYNLAKKLDTTSEVLLKLNSPKKYAKKGDTIKYKKASMKWCIHGWKTITTTNIKLYYNGVGVGDSLYAQKLDYCLQVMKGQDAAGISALEAADNVVKSVIGEKR